MKPCSRCGRELPLNQFTRRRGDGHGSYWSSCRRAYQRQHYSENRTRYIGRILQYRRREPARLRLLKTIPCADCGITYPYYVMDFDHREGVGKRWRRMITFASGPSSGD